MSNPQDWSPQDGKPPWHVDSQPTVAMPQGRTKPNMEQPNRSWAEAYRAYKANPREGHFVKIATKVLSIWLPFNVVDDVIPVFGQLDDPLLPATAGFIVYTLWRVNRYRKR